MTTRAAVIREPTRTPARAVTRPMLVMGGGPGFGVVNLLLADNNSNLLLADNNTVLLLA